MLKPQDHADLETRASEPDEITLSTCAVVTDILPIQHRKQIDALDDEHIWLPPLIDMRFNYRPANPLYVLVLRAYRLHESLRVVNTPEYAGCKSWVPFAHETKTGDALPVLDEVAFEYRRNRILGHLH